ncbi:hypothetical protein HDU97_002127 [Phlyctochytrium planicorne]|nr:hypothetical protein HDU97_002127 [Phlyctochytrium planicorne]
MPYVTVAHNHGSEPVNMYYEVHGNGPQKLLFVGGFGNICHQWDMQVDYFSRIPEYSVCIFDNRGGGLSSSPKGRYKTSEMAMDARDLLDFLGWKRFHLVGLSMGGMIAQELAHLCRHRILSLTLESTYAYFNGLPSVGFQGMVAKKPAGPRTVESFAKNVVDKLLFPEKWLNEPAPEGTPFETNRDHILNWMIERFSKTGLQDQQGRDNQQVACITHWMSTKRLHEIRDVHVPILVMTGTEDNVLIQPSSSIYLATMLKARLEIFEGGGHALRVQFPERHNELLLDHLKRAWKHYQIRQKDALLASIAAGSHVSTPRETVVWGSEITYERGWVEEKDPNFPDIVVERHIVEEVEFSEHLDLPSRSRRSQTETARSSTASTSYISARTSVIASSSSQPIPVASSSSSSSTSVPNPAQVSTLGSILSFVAVVNPFGLISSRQRPMAESRKKYDPSAEDAEDEDDDMLSPQRYSTPSSSVYGFEAPPKSPPRSPLCKPIPRRLSGDFGDLDDEGNADEALDENEEEEEEVVVRKSIMGFVGSSFKFGFRDFVSMIPGTPGSA